MFGIFKKKTENEKLRRALRNTIVRIDKIKGGCVSVCIDFSKSIGNSKILNSIGYIEEAVIKHDKSTIMYAALILLTLLRSNKLDDPDGMLIKMAETAFVLSSVIVSDEGLKQLMLNPTSIFIKRDELLEKYRAAWSDWNLMDIETLKKVTMI